MKRLKDNRYLPIGLFCLSALALLLLPLNEKRESPQEEIISPSDALTTIPAGFVLVPIEVANHAPLNSLLGNFGHVDLFTPPQNGTSQGRLVAGGVRIMRAPLDRTQFAVLVPETIAPKIVRFSEPLYVALRSAKSRHPPKPKTKKKRAKIEIIREEIAREEEAP
jgi:hypothetical protein